MKKVPPMWKAQLQRHFLGVKFCMPFQQNPTIKKIKHKKIWLLKTEPQHFGGLFTYCHAFVPVRMQYKRASNFTKIKSTQNHLYSSFP